MWRPCAKVEKTTKLLNHWVFTYSEEHIKSKNIGSDSPSVSLNTKPKIVKKEAH